MLPAKRTRFQRADQARSELRETPPSQGDGPILALDVDGQVTKEHGRPMSVQVYGNSYAFFSEVELFKVVIGERTYCLCELNGREALVPDQ